MITLSQGQYLSDVMDMIPSNWLWGYYLGTENRQKFHYHSPECSGNHKQMQEIPEPIRGL